MKKTAKVLFVLAILALVVLGNAPAPVGVYASEWRTLATGATAEFAHGLGVRPLDVHVWAAPGTDKNIPPYVQPYTDFPGLTFTVDAQRVIVTNTGKPVKVQVSAGR